MKKILLLTAAYVILLMNYTNAQEEEAYDNIGMHKGREKIEAQKIAYITQTLDLTPAEAQKFWPVYNQMNKEKTKLWEERPKTRKKLKDGIDELTDKELEAIADDEIIYAQKMLDIKKKSNEEFKKILPIKKVVKLYQAEKDFKKELLKKVRDFRKQEK